MTTTTDTEKITTTAEAAETLMSNDILQSFTQLSIVEAFDKLKRLKTSQHRSIKQRIRKTKSKELQQNDQKSYLPNYLNVPHRIFKKMFIDASENIIPMNQYSTINIWLDISKNMQYVREYARLLDKLLYLQLQQSLWADYFQIGITENVWASEIQEKVNRQVNNDSTSINSTSNSSNTVLSFVIHYRMNIDEELEKTENQLNEHLDCLKRVIDSTKSSQVQNINLSAILKAFVRKGQHKLNAELQCKRRLLEFDCQDHQLTKAFFNLKPTKQQV